MGAKKQADHYLLAALMLIRALGAAETRLTAPNRGGDEANAA